MRQATPIKIAPNARTQTRVDARKKPAERKDDQKLG